MRAYSDVYLGDVVENQGKLFDYVANTYPDKDTEDFINAYMTSKTRQSIDQAKAYVNTMDAKELWEYFKETEHYSLQQGKACKPDEQAHEKLYEARKFRPPHLFLLNGGQVLFKLYSWSVHGSCHTWSSLRTGHGDTQDTICQHHRNAYRRNSAYPHCGRIHRRYSRSAYDTGG